jgi:hypothetical protein
MIICGNVNHHTNQLFTATKAEGPWILIPMKKSFHDRSVLFGDDGKTYVVWGYDEAYLAELNSELTDILPGTEQVIVPYELAHNRSLVCTRINFATSITVG